MHTIGNRIRSLRKKQGLSQEEFADTIGVARQTISRWEKESDVPTIKSLELICSAFGLSMDYFLSAEGAEFTITEGEEGGAAAEPAPKKSKKKKIIATVISVIAVMTLAAIGGLVYLDLCLSSAFDDIEVVGESKGFTFNTQQVRALLIVLIISLAVCVIGLLIFLGINFYLKNRRKRK